MVAPQLFHPRHRIRFLQNRACHSVRAHNRCTQRVHRDTAQSWSENLYRHFLPAEVAEALLVASVAQSEIHYFEAFGEHFFERLDNDEWARRDFVVFCEIAKMSVVN